MSAHQIHSQTVSKSTYNLVQRGHQLHFDAFPIFVVVGRATDQPPARKVPEEWINTFQLNITALRTYLATLSSKSGSVNSTCW